MLHLVEQGLDDNEQADMKSNQSFSRKVQLYSICQLQ